ncbi:hypothetical protein M427DRAFT_308883 [Gonapodya prolifera JEL478]|uniref:Uncharacterized protein n=1 Tax=Gonapodya prolifera (strain JEL478) TaxID=1344416 RepID=A0A139AG82_GONPJ|nr:hypothetical protein M427DRAFT_308883 [Gonapodya prolifera JEL478]|eukprot:KXS15806.1 hypothetical protein M427DRAFT_308883 [Gonapodya prolifera JEL478]
MASGGADPPVASQSQNYGIEGSTRRSGKRLFRKRAVPVELRRPSEQRCTTTANRNNIDCHLLTHRCDARQPRCSHCEQRDIECDCSWEQKPRGLAADPLSARSAPLRRLNAQNIPLQHSPRDLLQLATSASSSPPATFHRKSAIKRRRASSLSLASDENRKDSSTGTPETAYRRTSLVDFTPSSLNGHDDLALTQGSYSSDSPKEAHNPSHRESGDAPRGPTRAKLGLFPADLTQAIQPEIRRHIV